MQFKLPNNHSCRRSAQVVECSRRLEAAYKNPEPNSCRSYSASLIHPSHSLTRDFNVLRTIFPMFRLFTILPILAVLVAHSAAAPHRGHRGGAGTAAAAGNAAATGVAVGTQTATADASQSTPCTAGAGGVDANLPLCKDVANGFGCTNAAFTNLCFGTPPCPGVTFTPADTAGAVCG
ncbi:hypothetical protein C8F01DRAFT_1351922 [Mycena amicta]|nr:hypothetical protein C8F01DRAFT_1351922 [Mycena amicta]